MPLPNFYAVILAGGSGTRFWPMSRKLLPKQFLKITGRRSLFQETLARIHPLVKGPQILIVTNKDHAAEIREQAREFKLPSANILLEPEGKNTAPAICWAASRVHRRDPNAVMAVLPSDHLILHPRAFLRQLRKAADLARRGYLVTLGIVPTRPETGYGYLKITPARSAGKTVWRVEKFTEKPSLDVAKKFVRTGRYLWNSGMFIWKCSVILDEFEKSLPKIHAGIFGKSDAQVRRAWKGLAGISIDYGILEKSGNVATVPAQDIGWSDLGSWESLAEVLTKDARNNVLRGDVVEVDCKNSLVFGGKRLVAAVGLENIIIVDTPDALLVCRKDRSQDVREVVSVLQKKKRKEFLRHP
ncbi:MAG: mannose-1-phosphate guanylyltransferase [Candidatus Omnitrophota bacterium]|nr:mannose-1-phosphate guanylyltransferase [Candidatus Omnitrophota bacterium]MDZ4242520.1 mannose-1-phosphate guanylyltransferase [Candidatus Omnitrophota bacterium]